MESVALPAGSLASPSKGEADLARAAARRDAAAFSELFHRHAQPMWRLAQAVTPDTEAAAAAVGDGFVRVLRALRRRQTNGQDPLRPALLAGAYRAALDTARRPDQAQRDAEATAVALRHGTREVDAALAMAAFRSLPERWRAAVWLREVEGFEPEAVAPVLGVSSAVAAQLTARGRRGLQGRFAQAGVAAPDHLGPLLRPLAAAVPGDLEATATARWRQGAAAEPAGRWLPAAGWLSERASRPLGVASAGVLAIGLIGLGVLGQHTGLLPGGAIRTSEAPTGTSSGVPTAGVSGAGYSTLPPGLGGGIDSPLSNYLTAAALGAGTAGGATGAAFGATPTGASGAGAGGAAAAPGTPVSSPAATPGHSSGRAGGSGGSSGGGTGGGGTGGGTGGGGTTTPTTPPTTTPPTTTPPSSTSPTTVVALPPVASVTTGGGTTTVNVLPVSAAPAASVSVGTCTEVNLLGIKVPVSCPAGTAPGTTLPAPSGTGATTGAGATTPTTVPGLGSAVGGVVSGVGGVLGGL